MKKLEIKCGWWSILLKALGSAEGLDAKGLLLRRVFFAEGRNAEGLQTERLRARGCIVAFVVISIRRPRFVSIVVCNYPH
jgi:hypothetical protein